MPRLPINYENTCFYKIVCRDLSIPDLYVGHTTDFTKRKNQHKTKCNTSCDYYVYRFIRDHGGWDNFDMVLIEQRNCFNRLEAEKHERKHIEDLKATLNQVIPTRSKKEWISDNKAKIKEYKHQYHVDHKEEIHEMKRNKYQEKKEKYSKGKSKL